MEEQHYHQILGSSDPQLLQAYLAYLDLEYYQDRAQHQQQVCNDFANLVITKYHTSLSGYISRRLFSKHKESTNDLVQDVSIAFYKQLRKNISTPDQLIRKNLFAMLCGIARHKITDLITGENAHEDIDEQAEPADEQSTAFLDTMEDKAVYESKGRAIFRRIVSEQPLKDAARQVLYYRVVKNESFTYISHKLNMSIDNAQKTMRRIINRLPNNGELLRQQIRG